MVTAKDFMEQASIHLKNGNIDCALRALNLVNENATKARSLAIGIKDKADVQTEWLLRSTQLLILADVLLESVVTTNKGQVIIPSSKLSQRQRENLSPASLTEVINQFKQVQSGNSLIISVYNKHKGALNSKKSQCQFNSNGFYCRSPK